MLNQTIIIFKMLKYKNFTKVIKLLNLGGGAIPKGLPGNFR